MQKEKKKIVNKGASLSLFISIWLGIIITGFLLGYNAQVERYTQLYNDPIGGMYTLLYEAFTNPRFLVFVSVTAVVTGGLTSILTGNSFAMLFILPMAIIFGMINIFILPTDIILMGGFDIPVEIQTIYSLILGSVTILTIVSFTAGRQ